jgi:outer membrane protein insertion porin family
MIKKVLLALGKGIGLSVVFICSIMAQTTSTPPTPHLDHHHPATYIIENIEFVGAKTLEPEALLAISNLKIGDFVQIPGSAITHAIQKLWQQKIIKDISVYASHIKGNHITLTFHIEESPRLSTYTFTGVKKREEKKLIEKLSLVRGRIVTPKLIKSVKDILRKHFLNEGYKDIQIDIKSLPDPKDADYSQLEIHIQKGEKLIVNKILVRGNYNISSDLLKAHLQHIQEKPKFTLLKDILYKVCTLQPIRSQGFLWHQPNLEEAIIYLKKHCIIHSTKFIKQKYIQDKQRLIQYYHSQGYRDATIIKDAVYKVREGLLNIALDIQEGEKYYIRNIKWVGNYIHNTDKLNKILAIRPGSVYMPALLQERLVFNPMGKDIGSLYMNDGYLFFHVEPVEVAIEGNKVDLELRVQEGPQATINNVNIRGNIYTHENVIRRELKTLPGDKFNKSKVFRSQRELAMLNVFDPNKIGILPIPNPANNTVDLLYNVKEAPRFDLKAGVGLASGSKLNFNIDVGTNNFSLANALRGKLPLGDVQSLHVKADFHGKNQQDFTLQFIEPWLMGQKPTALSFSITKSFQQQGGYRSSEQQFRSFEQKGKNNSHSFHSSLGSFGIRASLGKRLSWPDDYCTLKIGAGYRYYNYYRYDVLDNKTQHSGTTQEWLGEITLERNSINQPNYPTEGSLISLQVKLTPPYSLFSQQYSNKAGMLDDLKEKLKFKEYHQTMLDIGYFYNLFGDWVLNLFANGGALGSYSSNSTIGLFERFVMGGRGVSDFSLLGKELVSLRGYPEAYIMPKDKVTTYCKGGVLFNKVGIELRHPIIKSSMCFIYGLAFAEAGNTWARYEDWKILDLKKSAGIGVRFYSPIGLIGLDWGYGFDKSGTEKLEVHWSFGAGAR